MAFAIFLFKMSTMSRRRPTFAITLSSALKGLTSEFGKGSGVTLSFEAPRHNTHFSNNQIQIGYGLHSHNNFVE